MPRKPYFQAAISLNAPINDLGSKRRMIQLAVSGFPLKNILKNNRNYTTKHIIYFDHKFSMSTGFTNNSSNIDFLKSYA
jgi:hypothetical protein